MTTTNIASHYTFFKNSEQYAQFHGFNFYQFTIKHIRWIGGFGQIGWLKQKNWIYQNPKWSIKEMNIIEHMNNDHQNTIISSLKAEHNIEEIDPKIIFLTIDGYYIQGATNIYFIQLNKVCNTSSEYREELIRLAKENKKFEGNYPFNERAILSVNTKPTVALCNENSYSNAEIFSHAYKNLGLGKLVGQPTFGAVISTGSYSLSKGYVRMPFRAWYVKKSGLNMENDAPAVPDYLVKNKPGWGARGEDTQLQKAVEILLEEIK